MKWNGILLLLIAKTEQNKFAFKIHREIIAKSQICLVGLFSFSLLISFWPCIIYFHLVRSSVYEMRLSHNKCFGRNEIFSLTKISKQSRVKKRIWDFAHVFLTLIHSLLILVFGWGLVDADWEWEIKQKAKSHGIETLFWFSFLYIF